jgi:Domain of unknown function (DUF4878)
VVLVCLLALLTSAAALAGCGSGSSAQTPEQVMKAFWAAAMKSDASSSWNLLSADSQKLLKSKSALEAALKQTTPSSYKVGKATINGNNATVKVTYTVGGETTTESMSLIKENGVWKVKI